MFRKLKWIPVISLAIIVLLSVLAPPAARTASASGYDPNELSYGIYWFNAGNDYQKFNPDGANPYFDPTQPTLIFAHGWQPGLSNTTPNFMYNSTDTIAGWISDGWNVGIFVWNQFSDEAVVTDAEAKIWTPSGPQGMRWRDWNDYIDGYGVGPSDKCAAELFYEEYVAAMTKYDYTGGNIRIAGHSLGNQMAVRLTKLVDDGIAAGEASEHLRPTRVALLDPYWSPGSKGYLGGKTTGDAIREYVAELLPTGTLFEWYWSSDWTVEPDGDSNNDLKPMMMYAAMDPAYVSDDKDKHMAPRYLYFWSKGFPQVPPCTGIGDDCRLLGQMSDAQLASLMRSDYRWAQSAGQNTATPGDDTYQSTQQADAPYTVTQLQANPPTQDVGSIITLTATVTSTASPAPDGTLVTFATDLGAISARAAVNGGVALAHITSDVTGTAHISATTRGAGGAIQHTLSVTFTAPSPGQVPPEAVSINGPTTGVVATAYTFAATVTPISVTLPLTYVWQATNHTPVTHTGVVSLTDVCSFTWAVTGTQSITVTATNRLASRSGTHTIAIRQEQFIYLPLVLRSYVATQGQQKSHCSVSVAR